MNLFNRRSVRPLLPTDGASSDSPVPFAGSMDSSPAPSPSQHLPRNGSFESSDNL